MVPQHVVASLLLGAAAVIADMATTLVGGVLGALLALVVPVRRLSK